MEDEMNRALLCLAIMWQVQVTILSPLEHFICFPVWSDCISAEEFFLAESVPITIG